MKFQPNPKFIRELERDPRNRAVIRLAAEATALEAKLIAQTFRNTGYYLRRFNVVEEHGEVRMGNTDPFAHLIEWGSINNPPYAPLRRAVHAAGLEFNELLK